MFIIFSDEDSTDEQELIKRLTQGQARMEQIKRMLVNQRGFIVQALKQLTESNTSNVDVRQKFAQQIKEQKETIGNLLKQIIFQTEIWTKKSWFVVFFH